MDYFTISDIENLSGIKAHTLRVWEQRYGIIHPKRKHSQHRYYDNEDLKYILRIANLNRKGYKISKIARMTDEEIKALTVDLPQTGSIYENFISQMLEATLQLDEDKMNKAFHTISLYAGMENVINHVFYPLLSRLGLHWMGDILRPVQEHFASDFISRKLMMAINVLPPATQSPVTLLFTPVFEYHEIPILYAQYLLKKAGYRVVYFGASVHNEAIATYIAQHQVDRLHFHVITHFSGQTLPEMVEEMLSQFPAQEIVVSGPMANEIDFSHPRLKTIHSFEEMLAVCQHPVVSAAVTQNQPRPAP